jgi:pimeloyl-ACP methyl ester carboxylesterase
VVLFHGTPGARIVRPDEDTTVTAEVRLITIDRPGCGRSDPYPDLSLLTWADENAELHGMLGLPPCPIVGWSGGGLYAPACAVRAPALVSSVGLAASMAPTEERARAGRTSIPLPTCSALNEPLASLRSRRGARASPEIQCRSSPPGTQPERLEEPEHERPDRVEARECLEMVKAGQDLELDAQGVRGPALLVGPIVAARVDEGGRGDPPDVHREGSAGLDRHRPERGRVVDLPVVLPVLLREREPVP